jgi:hypothetical protein
MTTARQDPCSAGRTSFRENYGKGSCGRLRKSRWFVRGGWQRSNGCSWWCKVSVGVLLGHQPSYMALSTALLHQIGHTLVPPIRYRQDQSNYQSRHLHNVDWPDNWFIYPRCMSLQQPQQSGM